MRRRRKHQQGDSFDLFLDTITNTFGGVLLIALLIVLMIRENSDGAPKDHQAGPTVDLAVVESAIKALEAQRNSLAASLRDQKVFTEDFMDDGLEQLAKDLSKKISERNKLSAEAAELSRLIKQASTSSSGLAANGKQVKKDLAERTAEYEKLSEQLIAETASRTRTMSLPKEKKTTKDQVAMFFVSNQLFVVVDGNRGSRSARVNSKHFEKTTASLAELSFDKEYYRVRSGAGFDLGSEAFKAELKRYSVNDHYFTFVVRSNSFEEFSKLRGICVEQGYEYQIIATDGLIGQGGNNRRTQ